MALQDQIESFQKTIFSHFRHSTNNECRISALVPLVKESWGIYRFITSMLRAMYRSKSWFCPWSRLSKDWCLGTNDSDVLEPLRERYTSQHYNLRKFYYECSNLKYLTGLINVPKLGHVCKLFYLFISIMKPDYLRHILGASKPFRFKWRPSWPSGPSENCR